MINDISELVDRIEKAKDSVISQMEDFKESLDDCYDILHNAPCDELNKLIVNGFIPGARFVFDGNLPLTFVGYTEFLRLDFLKENDNQHIYVDVKPTAKRIDMFKKVEG